MTTPPCRSLTGDPTRHPPPEQPPGLVGGEGFAPETGTLKADASRQRAAPGDEGLDWLDTEQAPHFMLKARHVLDVKKEQIEDNLPKLVAQVREAMEHADGSKRNGGRSRRYGK